MTLGEFEDLAVNGELTDSAISARWTALIDYLTHLSTEQVKDLIDAGGLSSLVQYEGEDGFGTEGLNL
jgi:hypothetical protein